MTNKFALLSRRSVTKTEQFSDRRKRMFNFLQQNPTGVLSSVTPDGEPHGVVVYYMVRPDLSISFLTKVGTRKYDNLVHDDRVHLTVFEPKTQAVVQVAGHASEVKNSTEMNAIAGAIQRATLRTSVAGIPPIAKLRAGVYAAFTIAPSQIRMAVYARPDPGSYSEIFESVESFDVPA